MIDLPFTQLKHLFDSSNGFINCASDMQDPWFCVVLVGTCRYQLQNFEDMEVHDVLGESQCTMC